MHGVLLALIAAAAASAQQTAILHRGDIRVILRATGTVVTEDVFRLKSTIQGRTEAVLVSTYTWAAPKASLVILANQELAALMDARQTTPGEVMEERWQKVFRPARIFCPDDCYILHVYARFKKWVQPEAFLVEAAGGLRLIGNVARDEGGWLKDDLILEFWPKGDPSFKQRVPIHDIGHDASFRARLTPKLYLDPGTEWEGTILALEKKDVLIAPTSALMEFHGNIFLPLHISTGVTTRAWTEVLHWNDEGRMYLNLSTAAFSAVARHEVPANPIPPPKPVMDDSEWDKPAKDDDE